MTWLKNQTAVNGLLILNPSTNNKLHCLECGGVVRFVWEEREPEFVCTSCGLSLLIEDYFTELAKRFVRKMEHDFRREYLRWWYSSKKMKEVMKSV